MRLSDAQQNEIKRAVANFFKEGSRVYLFGSRTDDAAKGVAFHARAQSGCVIAGSEPSTVAYS